jgi:hypothetical protein
MWILFWGDGVMRMETASPKRLQFNLIHVYPKKKKILISTKSAKVWTLFVILILNSAGRILRDKYIV